MDATEVLVVALAAARLARLIRLDRIMDAPREFLVLAALNRAGPDRTPWLVEWLRCWWCVTVWTAAVACALQVVAPWLVLLLAVAHIAALLSRDQ